jgi:predicted component of type VI protein secretion system
MPLAKLDARLAELALLDVVDLRDDGTIRLNATFVATCMLAHAQSPAETEAVVRDCILARAEERGHVPALAPARLARVALMLGDAEMLVQA